MSWRVIVGISFAPEPWTFRNRSQSGPASMASHLDVAKSDGNLGNVLVDMGKPEEALVHLQKGLEI